MSSLGAVSVSHLDTIATDPSSVGSAYALENVAAAASGSIMVNFFGRLLEEEGVRCRDRVRDWCQ